MPQTALNAGVVTSSMPLQEIAHEVLCKIGKISDLDSHAS
jgi:chemotaxis response regulator CheB